VVSRAVYNHDPAALLALRAEMAEKVVQFQHGLRKVYLPLVLKALNSNRVNIQLSPAYGSPALSFYPMVWLSSPCFEINNKRLASLFTLCYTMAAK